MISQITNSIITYFLMKKISAPFNTWNAFKTGVIDNNGSILIKDKDRTQDQKESFSILDKLILNIKKILINVPGGLNKFSIFTAANLLLKESSILNLHDQLLESVEQPNIIINSFDNIYKLAKTSNTKRSKEFITLYNNMPNSIDDLSILYYKVVKSSNDPVNEFKKYFSKSIVENTIVNTIGGGAIAGVSATDSHNVLRILKRRKKNVKST